VRNIARVGGRPLFCITQYSFAVISKGEVKGLGKKRSFKHVNNGSRNRNSPCPHSSTSRECQLASCSHLNEAQALLRQHFLRESEAILGNSGEKASTFQMWMM